MVKYSSDRLGVMHWGKLLEIGSADAVYNHPLHPYTKSLLSAIPVPDPEVEKARQPLEYDTSIETDDKTRDMIEVNPGHFVLATPEEAALYTAQQV